MTGNLGFRLILLLCLVGQTVFGQPPCGGPLTRVADTYHSKLPEEVGLPEGQLKIQDGDSARYFSLIYRFWKSQADLARVERILRALENHEPISSDDRKFLKFARKACDLLRQGFVIFDEEGVVPPKLKRFVQEFGTLNDLISNENWDEAAKQAKGLRKDVAKLEDRDYAAEFEPGIPPINLYPIAKRIRLRLQEAPQWLPVEELHDVRKQMKRFMNYYRVAYGISGTKRDRDTFDYLRRLNEDLGDINDASVAKDLEGGTPYDDQRVRFPRDLRHRIMAFLDKLEW